MVLVPPPTEPTGDPFFSQATWSLQYQRQKEQADETGFVELNLIEAMNMAFDEEMTKDPRVMILGEDVGRDGGIFRLTDGLMDKHGEHRVVDTPISEMAIAGAATGLAMAGMRPIGEMQFSGFSYQAHHHYESHMARMLKRTNGRFKLPMVIHMPYGAGVRALEHHSESRETYWAHTPGLTVVMPSTPRNARSLLRAAIQSDEPVIFMEPKFLYRKYREPVPLEDEVAELRKTEVVQEGTDLTVVTWGAMRYFTDQAVAQLEEEGVSVELLDLQTIAPMDSETIIASVKKTGRCVIVQEAPRTLGPASEITRRINEDAWDHLEAPVGLVAAPDVHTPLLARENWYMPDETKVLVECRRILAA
ncbi:MAG: alpha-ketoacid dehydrogenase subunit beta [Thermoplasmatota archaeon]